LSDIFNLSLTFGASASTCHQQLQAGTPTKSN
jgi:hypothetical protein